MVRNVTAKNKSQIDGNPPTESEPESGEATASSSRVRSRAPASLGGHIRQLRQERNWSLSTLGSRSGIAASTLSKVENDSLSLTYDRLLMVAQGFGLSLSEFLAIPKDASGGKSEGLARMSFARSGSGERVETPGYISYYVCNNLRQKRMVPIMTYARARTLEEFGPLLRHDGEEFVVVVSGRVEVHTEFYEPEILEAGEGVYLDSRQGHAYLNAGDGEALLFSVNSEIPTETLTS